MPSFCSLHKGIHKGKAVLFQTSAAVGDKIMNKKEQSGRNKRNNNS